MCYSVNVVLHLLIFVSLVSITWAECGGKTAIYDLLNGTIALQPGIDKSYLANTYCEWLIKAPQPGQSILLIFQNFDTECGFDYLKIYDGSSKQRLLGSFSGNTIPQSLTSNTSAVVLDFYSDLNYVRGGSVIDFQITDCPRNCAGHGNCIANHCHCNELYTGAACDIEICPEYCNNGTRNGQCSKSDGCQCNADFIGQSCSFSLRNNLTTFGSWHLIKDHSSLFKNRFAHAGVYTRNAFWIFGGNDLNEVFDDLVKFDFGENKWQLIQPTGNRPTSRFRHTMVTFEDTLVVYGGELKNGTLLNDLWIFNITTSIWERKNGNNSDSPPRLASHCAIVHDGELIIFGGQTQDYGFSSEMYMFNLVQDVWRKISYNLAKISDLRLVGHSCVFYPPLKSLIVFGGYRAYDGRQSKKVATLLMYNLAGKVWLPIVTSDGPEPIVYHSSVVIGDYMVSYGGVAHTHHEDETCYGQDIYLLNLKNFTWSSIITDSRNNTSNIRGRYSHVVAVLNQKTLLVAGGFNGIASGDFWAYKFLPNVMHNSPATPHMCHMFTQCVTCLTWGSQDDLLCGWCVQDSTCYPRASPSGPCSTSQTTKGWWGTGGSFLTSVDQCRTEDKSPGLMAEIKFGDIIDHVYVLNPLKETIYANTRRLVVSQKFSSNLAVRWFGFIYPRLTDSTDEIVSLQFHGDKSASLHLSTDESPDNTVKVISFKGSKDGSILFSNEAKRPPNGSVPLFPNVATNKTYYVEVKIQHRIENEDGPTDSITLQLLNALHSVVIDGRYLRPFFSDKCEEYSTCLKCLSDMSCGWCSSTNTCIVRNSATKCQHSSGEDIYLALNASYCETCAQHVDCDSCTDVVCSWERHKEVCYDLQPTEDKKVATCVPSCTRYQDCRSCVSSAKCLWCESQDICIPWASHPASFIYGHCAHWTSIFSGKSRCSSCSQQKTCADCWKIPSCGWCGEFHNGSCFEGGYDAPYSGGCNQLISSGASASSYEWSYAKCPDENECITRRDCHEHAICTDTVGSYTCECKEGFEGDGVSCKALCNPPCDHGECIKHPSNISLDECECDLGWTGPVCSDDCGCYLHSTCQHGVGLCDDCQELTYGKHCESCMPGSFGSATTSLGCARCECNGHGDEQRGICDSRTGHCFCMNNTIGAQCDQCQPGFFGQPQRGEGCYYPCKAHAILSNMTRGTISSLFKPGENYDPNNVDCVWIITTLSGNSDEVVYSSKRAPGTITFHVKDIALDCQTDHVYVYNGMPNFKLDSNKSSFNLIGSLCGTNPSSIPAIESNSGTLVVVFKGNVGLNSRTNGFNASFLMNHCPNSCSGNRYCYNNGTHENCVCKPGWTGTACDDAICPADCSESLGNGHCDQISGKCVCKNSYAGQSCNIRYHSDDFIWKYSPYMEGSSPTLARMGHSLVADVTTDSLIIYGGYSLYFTFLGDIWKYNTKTKNYVRETSWSTAPRPRYFHAADIYKRVMYVTGGITNEGYSSEVWKYDVDSKQWQKGQDLPRKVSGHTLNIINDTLYLIGGYSPDDQCSSKVYTLNVDSASSDWTELNMVGGTFDACFGHTTVYDRFTRSLVIFGKKANKMEPTLAVLKLSTNELHVVSNVPQEYLRFFHVSMIVGDVMVVISGYTGGDVQDFAGQPLVYDLKCRSWHEHDLKGTGPSFLAHSAVSSMNGELYIFGGYNGLSSDKLYHQNTSSNWCAMFSTNVSCNKVSNCVWCVDIASRRAGCYVSNTHSHLSCSPTSNVCQNARYARSEASVWTLSTDVCIANTVPGDCSSCMQDVPDGDSTCSWSIDSHLCFSFFYQPIICAFGICGRVLRPYDVCPATCNTSDYCYDCLEQYNCGWCTSHHQNGQGVCTEGTLHGPHNGTCFNQNDSLAVWVSSVCLPENECVNGHHQCKENETCVDQVEEYKCVCSSGYGRKNGSCLPICSEGCVHGSCIHPDKCFCNFGWIGNNCSIACQCHGQGRCFNETRLDYCQDCQHGTAGRSCERCAPGYLGENGRCTSCFEKCNENAEICYNPAEKNTTDGTKYGPRDTVNLHCECGGNSEGSTCENCETGYFRSGKKCVECKCRGHAATCDKRTGLNCDCKNKTRTPPNGGNDKQCSQCSSPYLGSPVVEGQQCYRDLQVINYRRFAREDSKSTNLLPFQTSLYYIPPAISNIDVRLIIDIAYGSLDVFIANGDNAFKVDANQNVSVSLTSVRGPERYTDGLNTYTSFSGKTQVIIIRKVKYRLVVTFPYNEHTMEKAKFYIIIKAGYDGADGIIYFKQDNTKIDLIVFFIVFTSSFVFLLSAIFIGWSIKNHLHSRQEVHNREVENERLHNRPFARFAFLFEYQSPSPSVTRHRKTTGSTRKAVRAVSVQCTSDYHATVTTVLFQLPQTEKTKMALCLGTTLALVTPQQMDKLAQPSSPNKSD